MRKMLFYLYVKEYVNTLVYQGLLSIISNLKKHFRIHAVSEAIMDDAHVIKYIFPK